MHPMEVVGGVWETAACGLAIYVCAIEPCGVDFSALAVGLEDLDWMMRGEMEEKCAMDTRRN